MKLHKVNAMSLQFTYLFFTHALCFFLLAVPTLREPQVLEGTRLIIPFTPRSTPGSLTTTLSLHPGLLTISRPALGDGVTDFLTSVNSGCRLAFHPGPRLVGTTYFCLRGVAFRGEIVH